MKKFAALLALILILVPMPASTQDNYPTRPVKIMIAFPVGGLLDTVSRVVGEKVLVCWASSSWSKRAPAPAARSRPPRSPRPSPTATR